MVRLMLVLAPIACVLAGIAVSETLRTYSKFVKPRPYGVAKSKDAAEDLPLAREIGYIMIAGTTMLLVLFAFHCTWVTSEAYSSPSIVLAARQADGSRLIFDDFREAYWWLNMNTAPDARVMSWWDYGYQLAAMANRTIIVDNNTWNNTHISTVGTAFASNESVAIGIMRQLDVDYVLVIFGGLTGYASDDINKFLWMVRIGGSTRPSIIEKDYYTPSGEFRVDAGGSPTLLNCLMYKLCYYRFGQVYTERGRAGGYDRVRNVEIGKKDFELEYLEEAFTSQHWIVRLYKVKKPANRAVEEPVFIKHI
jgi:dolichyl-diphosphooligosaccharide--protein glycosyltransferase